MGREDESMMEDDALLALTGRLPALREGALDLGDMLLSSLVMVGEIPARTGGEDKRARLVMDRLRECGLDAAEDEVGNAQAILPGRKRSGSILCCAHMDTLYGSEVDHTVMVGKGTVEGAGIADNSLGVAVLCTLPILLGRLGIRLDSDLILLGSAQSLGRANLRGMESFIERHTGDIRAGICVEGVDLGRLSYQSVGMLRAEIQCRAGDGEPAGIREDRVIGVLAEVVRLIEEIPIPGQPRTSINLGAIHAGNSFHLPVSEGSLRLEMRSAMSGLIPQLHERLEEIVRKVALESGISLDMEIIARRSNGGIAFEHPLITTTRRLMEVMGIVPEVRPSVGELCSLIAKEIPGVTLGITRRARGTGGREAVRIEPMFSGIAQLVALLEAIDQGVCDVRDG